MSVKVCGTYLTPAQRKQFYGNQKRPVTRPAYRKKTQPKLNTFQDSLKSFLEGDNQI